MKRLFTFLIVSMFLTISAFAQEQNYSGMFSQNEDGTYFYMRSSLEMVYLTSETMLEKARVDEELVENAWKDYMDPTKNFPPQYNKHGAGIGSMPLGKIEEVNDKGDTIQVSDDVLRDRISKYIEDNKLANRLVMRWFNYNPYGTINYDIDNPENPDAKLNMATIFERGYYTVNAGEENVAMTALKRDKDTQIKELSMKLLPFTFLTFTELDYYDNEPVARVVRDAAKLTADIVYTAAVNNGANKKIDDIAHKAAHIAADAAYEATKDGKTLRSKTWLYRLVWDEETEAYFNNEVVDNPKLLETSDKFKMEFIDSQQNKSIVLISAGRDEQRVVDLTMVRNLNKVFSEMQKRNDVFKVWTPLLDFYSLVSPSLTAPITVEGKTITAQIGVKEGLRGGEQFSVVDEDGNFYGYVIAQPGMIWDNDEGEGDDAANRYEPQVDKKKQPVTATTFKAKGLKNARTGLLLSNPTPPKKMRVAARIGTKEGVEEGDKFDVYQYDAVAGKLDKKGTMTVVKGKVWDNIYYNNTDEGLVEEAEEILGEDGSAVEPLKKRDKEGLRVTETLFKGNCNVQPGMFLRKAK